MTALRLLMDFSDVLRALRVTNDLTQSDLAERAGVSRQLIVALESGMRPTSQQVDRLAAALGVPSGVLTGDSSVELFARNPSLSTVEVLTAAS